MDYTLLIFVNHFADISTSDEMFLINIVSVKTKTGFDGEL